MVNVSPLLGIVRNAAPQAAGQTLPALPETTNFSAVLTNLMALLKDLFDNPAVAVAPKDFSKNLGLGPQSDLVRVPEKSAPRTPSDPLRDFAAAAETVREGIRGEVEKRLDELPYEEAAVQIDEIRRLVQQIETRGMVGDDTGGAGTVVDEIMRKVHDLQRQFSLETQVNDEGAAPRSEPVQPFLPVTPEEEALEAPVLAPRPAAEPVSAPPTEVASALEPDAAPGDSRSLDLPEPEPAPAPRVKPPVTRETFEKILGVKVEEVQVAKPAPEPAPAPTHPAVPPVANLAAAAAHAEAPVTESGRSAGTPVRAAEAASNRLSEGARPQAPAQTPAPRTQERVEFVERIVRAAKLTRSEGQTRMRIVLNPPELGGIKVQLSLKDHVLSGTIHAEQSVAREFLLNHLQSLKDSLERQGIQVGDFQVNVEPGMEQSARDMNRDADSAPSFRSIAPQEVRRDDPAANDAGMRIRSARLQLVDLVA